jgi:hypothetical protein
MKKIFFSLILTFALLFTAVSPVVFAANSTPSITIDKCTAIGPQSTIGGIINWVSCTLVKDVVPLLFTLAVVGFIWGMIQFYLNPDNEEKRKKGKSFMIWGIVALFVMISMWGLVGVLSNTFGIKTLLPQLSQ